jgi:magnesium transporter
MRKNKTRRRRRPRVEQLASNESRARTAEVTSNEAAAPPSSDGQTNDAQSNDGLAAASGRAADVSELMETRALCIFACAGLLVTFTSSEQPLALRFVAERLAKARLRMRRSGSDYLCYAIFDAAIDSFFPIVDRLGDALERLDEQLLAEPLSDAGSARRIRHDLMYLRRTLLPMQQMLATLLADDSGWVATKTEPYLRDCVDHLARLLSLLDSYREFSRELTEAHMTALTQHTAEVSKVLTIIATVFIPLTFIAGLYGMNFDQRSPYNMPELRAPFGYLVVLGVMALLAVSLVIYFRKRGWLGSAKRTRQ